MRALLFTWEYPPRIIGKLAEYVSELADELVHNKVETCVITYHETLTGQTVENGACIFRVANPIHTHVNLMTWALTANQEVERAAASIYYQANKHVDVIDVYDWHFIPAAVTLKNALGIPFVYSVDSLEDHRSPGSNLPLNMAIRSVEWLGFYEAHTILVKSEWMKKEIIRIHNVPAEKIVVLPDAYEAAGKTLVKIYRGIIRGEGQ